MSFKSVVTTSLIALLTAAGSARASEVPAGFQDLQVADGLFSPTALAALPDGRLLVAQQNGVIRTLKDDALVAESFWEVPNVDFMYERGCLGITPDPNFENNHYVYAYCTIKGDSTSNNQVLRVTEVNGRADPSTLQMLIQLPEVRVQFHMGGALHFGPDGMLYVAVGNHEDGPETDSNSQHLENPFGKILRIKPDGSIPDDNPFVSQAGAFGAIWAYGYRNPFSFDVQPGTGLILVGDVGQSDWEEIDDCKKGANYGWSLAEGPSTDPRFEAPQFAFKHDSGRCSVTGGAFYNPKSPQFPAEFVGMFLFEEFCGGTIEVFDPATKQTRPFASGMNYPTNLAVAPDGSIYYLQRNQDTMTHDPSVGTLSKISFSGSGAPRISKNPASQTIVLGEPVTFEVTAQGATSIQWQRDGVDIPGATDAKYTIEHTTEQDNGVRFVAVAKNDLGNAPSLAAELTITTNRPPMAAIAGAERIEYEPGEMITLKGSAKDVEDGDLPASAFTWQVDYQHDTHTHPFLAAMSGSDSVSFMVPSFEADEPDTWVRVELFVKDSGGSTNSVYRDIYPRTQLSSLTPLDPITNGLGPIERDRSNGGEGVDGKPIVIDGIPFNTGLGMHAPAEVRYNLDGRCSGKFVAAVGLDDEVGDRGSVVFQVFLDDKMAYDSGVKHGNDARASVLLDLTGSQQLRLVVTDGGDGDTDDNADWGAARVMGCTGLVASGTTAGDSAAASGMNGGQAADEKPAASSGSEVSSSSARAGASDESSNTDAGKASTKSSSVAAGGNIDAGTDAPASSDGGGCSVGRVASNKTPASSWLVLLTLSTGAWWRRRSRTRH